MFCHECGASIPDDSVFCENCGAQLEPFDDINNDEKLDEIEGIEEVDVLEDSMPEESAPEVPPCDEDELEEVEVIEEVEEEVTESDDADEAEIDDAEEDAEEEAAESDDADDAEEAAEETEEITESDDAEEAENDDAEEDAEEEVAESDDADDADEVVDEPDEIEGSEEIEEELPDVFSLEDMKVGETGQPGESKEDWFKSFEELTPSDDDWAEDKGEHKTTVEDMIEEELPDVTETEGDHKEKPTVEDLIEYELPDETEIYDEPVLEEPVAPEKMQEVEEYEEPASSLEAASEVISNASAKIGSWLSNLGKSVHTGTGWAADAVKEKLTEIKDSMSEDSEAEEVLKDAETEAIEVIPEEPAGTEEVEGVEENAEAEEILEDAETEATEVIPEEPAETEEVEGVEENAEAEEVLEDAETEAIEVIPEETDEPEARPARTHRKGRSSKAIERNSWSDEEIGELDLSSDFWYSSRKEKQEEVGAGAKAETGSGHGDVDDMTTKVVPVRRVDPSKAASTTGTSRSSGRKLRIIVLVALIAVLLGAGGVFGSKIHKEKQLEDKYQTSIAQANEFTDARDYQSAEEIYKNLIKEYPDRAELYENLARVYIAEEKFDEAKEIVAEGVAKTGKSESFTALSEDLKALTSTEWREPFRRVLAGNEWAVRRYDKVNDVSVALCDVTGDKKPELFFFTQEYYGYGKLHIYTYVDEKAQEITYSNKNRSTEYDDAFYDVERDDSSYVIYKGKKDGEFGIYESFLHGGVDAWQTINEFTLTGTECKKRNVIEACIKTDYRLSDDEDEEESNNKYYKGKYQVEYKTYFKNFQRILNDLDQVVITSKESSGDKEIWSRIVSLKEASMDYDGAMKILDEDAN